MIHSLPYDTLAGKNAPGPKALRLSSEQLDAFEQLRALRVPTALIARQFGFNPRTLYRRLANEPVPKVTTPNSIGWREARHERIKSHIAAYPNKSLFGGEE